MKGNRLFMARPRSASVLRLCVCGSPDVTWCPGAKDGLTWSSVPEASGYVVYRGGPETLTDLLTAAADSCEAGRFASTSTGASLRAAPAAGTLFWYLVTAANEAGEGAA